MKRNGFTLVELLGVVAVLAVLAIVISMPVTKMIKDGNTTACEKQLDMILTAAKLWGKENTDLLPKEINEESSIYLNTLIDEGLFDGNAKNPLTNEKLENIKITIKKTANKRWSYNLELTENYCK